MKSNYKQLGQFIRQVDVRNSEGKEENLLGVSVQKKFIPSIANTVGTDFKKYKVVKKGQFTYIPDTSRRGDKIGIALLEDYEEGLVSNVYTVFEIIDEKQLIPEYLMLWFSRPEFDRYARFKSHGSVREVMDWDEMCKVELPVPPYEKQKEIVDGYKAITERIALKQKINDNLEATLNAVYKEFFTVASPDELPYGWKIAPFSEIASITMGQSPEGDDCNTSGFGKALLNGPTEFGFYSPSPVQWTTTVKKHCVEGDLLFCVRGSTTGRMNWANQSYAIGRGLAAIHHKTTPNLNWFIKAMIDNNLQEILAAATGSTFPNVGKDLLNGFKVIIPDDTTLQKFGSKGYAISRLITANAKEIDTLLVFQKTLLSKLTI
ncbi:restriction endonuclease subunit S [Lachnospiraceae bacterium 50-23]|uniref:restriction endonuclease subunit S n=1 Tax=Blautia producta TaxID=33035 RepID=UPI0035627920